MAIRTRMNPGTWSVALPTRIVAKDGKITEAVANQLYSDQLSLAKRLNGLISLGNADDGTWSGNIDGQFRTFLAGTAGDEILIEHGLGRIPRGYIPVRKDRAGDFYDSRSDAWTTTTMYVKCSVDDITATLLIF
jgi:hypothetical protein